MYRALLTVVLNVCIASASAATPPVPASTTAPRETAARITLQPEAKIQAKAQAQAQALKVNTKLTERQSLRPTSPSTSNESTAGDSGENPYGTLLITLVLMGAIALRRRGSGTP